MKTLFTITVLFCGAAGMAAEEQPIDLSIVFKNSRTYLDISKRNPDQRHLLMVDSRTAEWTQVAIVEDHPTHVVTLDRLRVYANGRIERLILEDDGEEAWVSDQRPDKAHSTQASTEQPDADPESKSGGSDQPQPEPDGHSR